MATIKNTVVGIQKRILLGPGNLNPITPTIKDTANHIAYPFKMPQIKLDAIHREIVNYYKYV